MKPCTCGCDEWDHNGDGRGKCSRCVCMAFSAALPHVVSLAARLEAVSLAVQGALEEVDTYQGLDARTHMPVWASGDDFRAHGDLLDILDKVERLRGRLRLGMWHGRTPS